MAATPATVARLVALGYHVVVEPGAGASSRFSDAAYEEAGARLGDPWSAEIVLKVNGPSGEEIARLREGATLVAFIGPAHHPELVEELARRPITVLAMDAVPRISRAQSMDVLSSMANIAGYRAAVEAAHAFGRGAPLARLEARIAAPLGFAKLPGLALDGEPSYRPSTVSRAPSSLPVTFRNVG